MPSPSPLRRDRVIDLAAVHAAFQGFGAATQRRGPHPVGDTERLELGGQVGGAVVDDEVGFVRGDRLDVGRVARQVGLLGLCLGREVALVVDGDHLVARADREEHLGGRRRQADDPFRRVAGHDRRCDEGGDRQRIFDRPGGARADQDRKSVV